MDFVTVFTAFTPAEAYSVRSRLEAAGFKPVLDNENASSYLGGFSSATMIRVSVPEAEAIEAKEFLAAPAE